MNALDTACLADLDTEGVLRHIGVYARDAYEFTGYDGPIQITGASTTVRWDPEQDAAVFVLEVDGEQVTTTVPSIALDAVGLVVA